MADEVIGAHGAQKLVAVRAVLKALLVAAHLVRQLTTREVSRKLALLERRVNAAQLALVEGEGAGVREQPAVHPQAGVKPHDLLAKGGLGLTAATHVRHVGEVVSARHALKPATAAAAHAGTPA